MKKIPALFLVSSLLQFSCMTLRNPSNGSDLGVSFEKPGVQITIVKKDGSNLNGELVRVNESSLLLGIKSLKTDFAIDIQDIKTITLPKKPNRTRGRVLGALIGGALGAAIGSSGQSPWDQVYTTLGAIIFGGLGALAGGGTYPDEKTESFETIYIEGETDQQIVISLEKLRKKARIQDYN